MDFGPPVVAKYQFLCLFDSWVADRDMVVTTGNDLSSYRLVSGNVNSFVVDQESVFFRDSAFVVKGVCDSLVPLGVIASCTLDAFERFVEGRHHECLEVFGLEDDDLLVVVLSLIMVCMTGE